MSSLEKILVIQQYFGGMQSNEEKKIGNRKNTRNVLERLKG